MALAMAVGGGVVHDDVVHLTVDHSGEGQSGVVVLHLLAGQALEAVAVGIVGVAVNVDGAGGAALATDLGVLLALQDLLHVLFGLALIKVGAIAGDHQVLVGAVVGIAEGNDLLTGGGDGQAGHTDIAQTLLHGGNHSLKLHILDNQLFAQVLSQAGGDLQVDTEELAVLHHLEGLKAGGGGHDQLILSRVLLSGGNLVGGAVTEVVVADLVEGAVLFDLLQILVDLSQQLGILFVHAESVLLFGQGDVDDLDLLGGVVTLLAASAAQRSQDDHNGQNGNKLFHNYTLLVKFVSTGLSVDKGDNTPFLRICQ